MWGAPGGNGDELRKAQLRVEEEEGKLREGEARVMGGRGAGKRAGHPMRGRGAGLEEDEGQGSEAAGVGQGGGRAGTQVEGGGGGGSLQGAPGLPRPGGRHHCH